MPKDPTEAIRKKASRYPDVDEGTACTQSSFKVNKKAFLFVGMQGGRYKAMFKLDASKSEAERLSKQSPDRFAVGSTAWVTVRFSTEEPMPKTLWEKWLDESYQISIGNRSTLKKNKTATKKPPARKASKRAAKKATKRKASAKNVGKKTVKKTKTTTNPNLPRKKK